MTEREWDAKCGGMFLGLLGAVNLARILGLDPHLMLDLLIAKLDEKTTTPSMKSDAVLGE